MCCADVGGGEEGDEGGVGGGGFDVGSASLLTVYEAEDAYHVHAGFAGGFDGCDGGASGGADIVDDDYVGSEFVEAFEAATGAVGLFGLADEEAVDGMGGVVVIPRADSLEAGTLKFFRILHHFLEGCS